MNVVTAAQSTLELLRVRDKSVYPCRDSEGRNIQHAVWMLDGIILGYIQAEKAQRWLGYVQGLLIALNKLTLDDAKSINRNS